jgi:hypothetical protein
VKHNSNNNSSSVTKSATTDQQKQQSKAVTSSINSSSTPSSSNINNKSSNDEFNKNKNKSTESSSSGPSTSTRTIQSYDKPTFSKPDVVTTTSTSLSNSNKPFSNISSRSSSIERLLFDAEQIDINSVAGRLINSSSIASIEDEIMYIKPASNSKTKTVKVRSSDSKETTVTNNFKLPPFPVYIPSSDIPSLLSSRANSISNVHSKLNSPDSSYSSGTTAFNASLTNRLSELASTTTASATSKSSPSRTINNYSTSTLPLKLGRNNPYLYHSESNNTTSNEKSASTAASSSNSLSTSGFSSSSPATSSYTSQNQSNYNNIYSTLPKTTSSYISKFDSASTNGGGNESSRSYTTSPFSKYSNNHDYYSNNVSSTSTSHTNGTSTYTSSNNHNTNVFKVQYSSTNPFLDELNSSSKSSSSVKSNDDNIDGSSIFRNSVSETRKKFEKLEEELNLK